MESISFLVLEDDQIDAEAIRRAFRELGISNQLIIVKDGIEALDCLHGSEKHGKLTPPFVIFVDLIMPRMSGLEFLDHLKEIPEARSAPVFVMSGSSDQDDIFRAYSHDIVGYIVKSDPVKSIRKALELLDYQWLLMKP